MWRERSERRRSRQLQRAGPPTPSGALSTLSFVAVTWTRSSRPSSWTRRTRRRLGGWRSSSGADGNEGQEGTSGVAGVAGEDGPPANLDEEMGRIDPVDLDCSATSAQGGGVAAGFAGAGEEPPRPRAYVLHGVAGAVASPCLACRCRALCWRVACAASCGCVCQFEF